MFNEITTLNDYVLYVLLGLAVLTLGLSIFKYRARAARRSERGGFVFGVLVIAFLVGAFFWENLVLRGFSYSVVIVEVKEKRTTYRLERVMNGVEYTFPSGKKIAIPRPAQRDADPVEPVTVIINASPAPARVIELTKPERNVFNEKTLYTFEPETAETIPLWVDVYFAKQDLWRWKKLAIGSRVRLIFNWTETFTNIVIVNEEAGALKVDYQVKTVGENFIFADGSQITFDVPEALGSILINNSSQTVSLRRINYAVRGVYGEGSKVLVKLAPMSSGFYNAYRVDHIWPEKPPSTITLTGNKYGAVRYWLTREDEN